MYGGAGADGSVMDVMDKWSDNNAYEGIDVDSLVNPDRIMGLPIKVVIISEKDKGLLEEAFYTNPHHPERLLGTDRIL